jgi:hypothetical protein
MGVHWCYGHDGSFKWENNRDDPEGLRAIEEDDVAAGSTPPDHKSYISPVDMVKHYYLSTHTDTEITDQEEIARLERDECEEGASINRPVDPEEWERIMKNRKRRNRKKKK